MGLLKSLVLLPLAPAEGVVWIARQLQAQIDREMFGAEAILGELAALQNDLDEGIISEAEYVDAEAELLDRLEMMEEAE